ncbi:fused MFS/spermidine synthase [Terriglobus sp. TAA 43]|uniref:fused MFS/spermidine synthase n=1 Tax=Terriglobus sp. TAA 43 TaxID=278961 RepID=UPI000AB48831|nr:fused MFS/spermidine synthase [Terriglobus sp. TAA 43]
MTAATMLAIQEKVTDATSAFHPKRITLIVALALSGVSALIFQVLWARQLSLVVGVEVYAITLAVSAFFAGIAGGSALFGRMADRVGAPLRLYAILEASIAATALTVTLLLSSMAVVYAKLQDHVGFFALVLPFVIVSMPALLMGGTLPVAVRAMRSSSQRMAVDGGFLYTANTAGGIVGVLITSFALIPWIGLRGTALVAALLNLIAYAVVWQQRTEMTQQAEKAVVTEKRHASSIVPSHLPLILYALAGAVALGYEVVWSQAIAQFVSTRAFAFSIVLAVYLSGLALGAWFGSRLVKRAQDSWGTFGLLISGAGLISMLEFSVMGRWTVLTQMRIGEFVLQATGTDALRMYASFATAGVGLVFLPTLLLGAAFPVVLRLVTGKSGAGSAVGNALSANTAAGIVGTMITGFVMIPMLGAVRTLSLLTIVAAAIGAVATLFARRRWMKLVVGFIALSTMVAAAVTPANRLANLLLLTRGGGALVFYEEGRGATVAVAQQRSKDNVFRRLFVQGVSNSGDAMPSMRYMRLQTMIPLLIHNGEPRSVMIVGFGTGITAGETLRYPGLTTRVCAELLPSIVRAGKMFPENYNAWNDARLNIRVRDGRQELMHSDELYDVITLEPPPPSAQGVANLYSFEFYELAKKRLNQNGILAQWLPIATQNEQQTRELVRSFLDAFPYATLWTTELHEMLLVGSPQPIRIDIHALQERFAPESVAASMKGVGIDSPAAVLATWVTGRSGLERFAGEANPVTDDHPRIEYGPWVRQDEITHVLPKLLDLRTEVPVIGSNAELNAEVKQRQSALFDFYTAGLAAYAGDRTTWEKAIRRVASVDPENAYYQWIIGRE